MKSIVRLTLFSLTILTSTVYCAQPAKEIYKAVKKTSGKVNCPAKVRQFLNSNNENSVNNNSLREASANFNIEDIGFVLASMLDSFFDKDVPGSLSTQVQLFTFANNNIIQNKAPQFSAFIKKLEGIKNSTSAAAVSKTMKAELESLGAKLAQGSQQERNFASKMKKDVDQILAQRGTVALTSIIINRTKLNK